MGLMICVNSEPRQRAFCWEVGPAQVHSDYLYPCSLSYLMREVIPAPKVVKIILSSSPNERQFRKFDSIFLSVDKMHIWIEFRNLQVRLLKN